MLVRLDQIDPRSADGAAGWTTGGLRGTVAYAWPAATFAYQLRTLPTDERGEAVPVAARQAEARRLVAVTVAALAGTDDVVVVRVDGPFGPGLMPAVVAAAATTTGPCAVAGVYRSAADPAPPQTSVRLAMTVGELDRLARDPALSLAAGVRVRAFVLPLPRVEPMVDTHDVDDDRWQHLLPAAAGVVSTAADLLSVVIWTAKVAPDLLRDRLATGLAFPSVARAGDTAVPAVVAHAAAAVCPA